MKLVVACTMAVVALAVASPTQADPAERFPVGRSFAPPGSGTESAPAGSGPLGNRDSAADQPDAEPDASQTHVVYFVPKDRPDENLDENGALARSVSSMREWFARETGRSGAPIRPRMDRLPGGGWDITFVRGRENAETYNSLASIRDDLVAQGFDRPNKRYLIYAALGRGNTCGEGFFPIPAVPQSGRYAVVYLDSNQQCGAREFGGGTVAASGKSDTIAAHEWLHNEGVTSPLAPHHCPVSLYHVCTGPLALVPGDLDPEAPDIVFPFINAPLKDKVLDLDLDDYLDHSWPHLHDLRLSAWFE